MVKKPYNHTLNMARGLQRDGAAAREGVHHQGSLLWVGGLHQPRPVSRYSVLAALSQLAKSATNMRNALRKSNSVSTVDSQPEARPSIPNRSSRARDLKSFGQRGSYGSGSTARDDAKGRRTSPQMQRRGMPTPYRLLPRRGPRHLGNGEVNLSQAHAGLGDHRSVLPRIR